MSGWRSFWNEGERKEDPCRRKVLQKVPELTVHERMSQDEKARGTKEKKKAQGWSTEDMKDKPSSSLGEDTGEMIEWRGMNQEEVDQCWKKSTEKLTKRFWTSTKVEDSKREACRGRGSSSEWRRVRRSRKYRTRELGEDCCAILFALFREHNVIRWKKKR